MKDGFFNCFFFEYLSFILSFIPSLDGPQHNWIIYQSGNDFKIMSVHSGKFLTDVKDKNKEEKYQLSLLKETNDDVQSWIIHRYKNNRFKISNKSNFQCLFRFIHMLSPDWESVITGFKNIGFLRKQIKAYGYFFGGGLLITFPSKKVDFDFRLLGGYMNAILKIPSLNVNADGNAFGFDIGA